MARLLFLPSSEAALDFCSIVGLPMEEDCVIMKAAPVSNSVVLQLGRCEDAFVFRGCDWWENTEESRVDDDGVFIPPGSFLQRVVSNNCF